MTTPDLTQEDGLLDGEDDAVALVDADALDHEDPRKPFAPGTFRKIGTAMATLVALTLSTYVVAPLSEARPWVKDRDPVVFWNLIGREFLDRPEEAAEAEAHDAEVAELVANIGNDPEPEVIAEVQVVEAPPDNALPAYKAHPDDEKKILQALEMPDPAALDGLFVRLARTEAGYEHAITRVSHWGDSVIGTDNVTSTLRARMQSRFGDAGHGFHLLAKSNTSYRHRGVAFTEGSSGPAWMRCFIIKGCKKDGRYGFGGTTVWSSGGARTRIGTSDKRPYGQKVSRFEVWYAAGPNAGKLRLRVDKEEATVLETAADVAQDKWHEIKVADGAHRLELRASGGGRVRLYGVVLERDTPGVVWDAMAQVGAFTSRMTNFEPTHIREQIAHRDPGLLVFQFGGNDLLSASGAIGRFKAATTEMIQRFRAQDDPPSCLVISPVDHGERTGARIVSVSAMERVTLAQQEVALAQGCAFFDSRAAMGGKNSVARWRSRKLISGDLAHLTNAGQRVLGEMVYLALMQRYREYRERTD